MIRIVYFLLITLLFIVPVAIVKLLPGTYGHRIYRIFYKFLCAIMSVKPSAHGKLATDEPVLFVSNHVSYLDILVLGAILPGSFISKSEVANWPIIGWIAWLTGTVFIDRKRSAAEGHLHQLEKALKNGKNLILFAEGTTGDGIRVMPFKSSLFKIAEDNKITIQPVTIKYSKINGLPVQRNEQSLIAWIGDMDLTPHMKKLLSLGVVQAEITLHEPIENSKDRKKIAEKCHDKVAS